MRFLQAVILALCLVLGVNSLPSVEVFKGIPRRQLGRYQLRFLSQTQKIKKSPMTAKNRLNVGIERTTEQ
jgi:hypothetical protein